MDALARMQKLLRDLFRMDTADLDFGLYRLLHLQRTELEAFITEQLPAQVEQAFEQVTAEEREGLKQRVEELQAKLRRELDDEEAILPDGSVNEQYRQVPGRTVRELVAAYETEYPKLMQSQASEAQQAEVFNHLYAFFSRYYQDGDFIPRRRYGASETYAVPYDGQEVALHWANKGQHYVKTAEWLRDYAFTVDALGGPYRVRFVLAKATEPRDNNKGETRLFFPKPEDATYEGTTFTLPFEYRVPTQTELERYGKNTKGQGAILQEAHDHILAAVTQDILAAALKHVAQVTDKEEVSLLLRHLRHFVRRQTSDFFVHPDLKGFLDSELEFYLKDQVLHLADIEGDLPAKLRMLRVIRRLGQDIIAFLDQIEQVRCRLFEKRKFVLRADYLCPIQHVPRELWPEVLVNKAQRARWRELFAIEGEVNEDFLQAHPTLVVDTACFDEGFKLRLLAAFPDLDEAIDGLLIHGENCQALNLLQERYRGQVKCIYIDPPYNSPSSEIAYKNNYKHSSWLALLYGRLAAARNLSTADGSCIVAIDKNEHHRLLAMLEDLYPDEDITSVSVEHNKKGIQGDHFSYTNEFAIFVIPYALKRLNRVMLARDEWEYANLRNWGGESLRTDGRNCFYPIFVTDSEVVGFGDVCPDDFHPPAANVELEDGRIAIYPIDDDGVERKWRYARDTVEGIWHLLKVEVSRSGALQIMKAKADAQFKTMWYSPLYNAGDYGTKVLSNMGILGEFDYPKSIHTVRDCIFAVSDCQTIALDYFAGSGTTGHAVLNLNREDGGRRKFILVEMADYFDTVLLPRIQKVMYCPEWRDGKPANYPQPSLEGMWPEWVARTPRLVKVLRLEGYEDSLHNLVTEETLARTQDRAEAYREAMGAETYRLHYLVRLPMEASATMLNTEKLEHPFRYTLEILTDDGPAVRSVDLVETFNLLYGLQVQHIETWRNEADGREYRAVSGSKRDGTRVLVLWRDMEGLDPAIERAYLEGRLAGYDQVLINGDCAVPGVASLDPLFKRLMEAREP